MYQQRIQPQPIVPISYDSPKMLQIPIKSQMQAGQAQMMQPTTFMQQGLPLPTQIQQQRMTAQQSQQEQQKAYEQNQYVSQMERTQRQRFVESQSPKFQFQPSLESQINLGVGAPKQAYMGEDVYLVAFLLGVEVERLRIENDQFQLDKDAVEAKMRAITVIEGELKQARIKMGEYEKRHALMQSEMESWKSRHNSKEQEQEDSRYQQDFQRRITVDREIRELTAKFISDRNYLENENNKLRQDLDALRLRHGGLDDTMASAQIIEDENKRIKKELDNYRQSFEQLEYVFKTASDLEQENEFLKQQIQEYRKSRGGEDPEKFRLLSNENAELKKILGQSQISNGSSYNVDRMMKELQMFEAENKRLRQRLQLQGGSQTGEQQLDGAFCY